MRSNIGAESPGKAIVCNNMYCASASISRSHNVEETVVEGKRGKRNTKQFFAFLFNVEVNIVPCHLMVDYFSKYGRYENFICPEKLLMD